MSRFHVGQRVRLVRPYHAEFYGDTGTIFSLFTERDSVTYAVNCEVDWDQPPNEGVSRLTHTSRLEPITYDGNKVVRWEECEWQPPRVTT